MFYSDHHHEVRQAFIQIQAFLIYTTPRPLRHFHSLRCKQVANVSKTVSYQHWYVDGDIVRGP